jgi:hypothetical protein
MIGRLWIAGLLPVLLLADTASGVAHPQQPQSTSQQQSETNAQQHERDGGQDSTLSALRQGRLTIWYVGAPSHPPQTNLQAIAGLHDATPLTYQSRTTGGFGQSSSSYGEDAAGYGVDADSRSISVPQAGPGRDAPAATPNGIGYKQLESGSFGQEANTYGQEASTYGTTGTGGPKSDGSFGQSASSFGEKSGDNGQDVGSFGNTLSTVATAANNTPKPPSDPATETFRARLQQNFPDLQLRFTEVAADELKDRLLDERGTPDYPDVLVGSLPQSWWRGMQAEFGLAMLRPAAFYPNGVTEPPPPSVPFAILAHAPHMREARAFGLWMSEPYSGCAGCVEAGLSKREQAAATVGFSAMQRLLDGGSVDGEADPEMAHTSALGVDRMLSTLGGTSAASATPHIEVERVSVNGSIAAVALRVMVSSPGVFGVAHPLLVLREQKDGHWKVLQVSLNLQQIEQASFRQALMDTSAPGAAEQRAGVKGVTLAAPTEGATSSPRPDLVWDNNGGAGLQVVEWQMGHEGGWSDSRLYLVEDHSPRLQTHVRAEFAVFPGQYHWRVWSIGAHGNMKISPWRTFNVTR